MYTAMVVNCYFLCDLIMNMIVFGCSYIVEAKKILIIEMICQILSLIAMIDFFKTANDGYGETVTSV